MWNERQCPPNHRLIYLWLPLYPKEDLACPVNSTIMTIWSDVISVSDQRLSMSQSCFHFDRKWWCYVKRNMIADTFSVIRNDDGMMTRICYHACRRHHTHIYLSILICGQLRDSLRHWYNDMMIPHRRLLATNCFCVDPACV